MIPEIIILGSLAGKIDTCRLIHLVKTSIRESEVRLPSTEYRKEYQRNCRRGKGLRYLARAMTTSRAAAAS